jgi:hypothetical protein
MNINSGIYWIQGLVDGEWSNIQRCDEHADAVSRMGALANDPRYRELRLVLAKMQKGEIEYTTLVTVRDGEIVSSNPLLDSLLPPADNAEAKPAQAGSCRRWRIPALAAVLVLAIAGGVVTANRYPDLALSLYRAMGWQGGADRAVRQANAPSAKDFTDRLFEAVDADDGAAIRRLMAARPGDLHLDGLIQFVDDSWGAGPRKIVDYALLGGYMSAADALLSTGAVPSEWLLALLQRHPDDPKMKAAAALLAEFGSVKPVSLDSAIVQTAREFGGQPAN